MAIKIDQLAAEVNKQLAAFAGATDDIVETSAEDVAKATVQQLKTTSPKLTGKYARSWTIYRPKSGPYRHTKIVHAGDGEYRLTHLLEYGHAKVNGGRVQPSPAGGHIEPAEQAAIADFEAEIRRKVEALR